MAMMSTTETQLHNAQSSILFMQQEHSKTLQGLHVEIQKLQKKCSDLTFELAMKTTTTVDEDYYMKKIKSLEMVLRDRNIRNEEQEKDLEKKDKRMNLLEQKLKAQEKKFVDELKGQKQYIASITGELEQKSAHIAYLTTQLHQEKLRRKNRDDRSVERSENKDTKKPLPPREAAPGSGRRRLMRSTTSPVPVDSKTGTFKITPPSSAKGTSYVSNGRIGSGGRRLPTQPVRSDSPSILGDAPDPRPFLVASEPTNGSVCIEMKPSPPVLPPITALDDAEAKHTLSRRKFRVPNRLAVDQITDQEHRSYEKSPTDCS
ncbi:coiled-coil domain-containing protein 92-like [Saccoglossus kowalevskii]|uniref:Coiled-coil domain-containing protein 92-like n=1 Tax=Saccoglossus kowalevskii TaxID=10224 RepID=A0ABM0GJI1_SACKO|nr:PREDICTED: coiled-coil domain-containing protein 92-like [Saccoglossus kowalevskii]